MKTIEIFGYEVCGTKLCCSCVEATAGGPMDDDIEITQDDYSFRCDNCEDKIVTRSE